MPLPAELTSANVTSLVATERTVIYWAHLVLLGARSAQHGDRHSQPLGSMAISQTKPRLLAAQNPLDSTAFASRTRCGSKFRASPWQSSCRASAALTQQDLLGPAPAKEPRACRLGSGVMVAQLAPAAHTHQMLSLMREIRLP